MNPTHLDLFSGIGGFSIAAQNCGFQTIAFCEKELYAQQILKEKFGAVLADSSGLHGDGSTSDAGSSRKIPRPNAAKKRELGGACFHPTLHDNIFALNGADYLGVDLLTGGFPCQPFSVAGKRRGKEDDRAIWPEMLRVIKESKPTFILGENVAGIITMELDNIISDMETLGYTCWPLVIPACAVDAKHRRDRVWILGHATSSQREGRSLPIGVCEKHTDIGLGRNDGAALQDVANSMCQRGCSGTTGEQYASSTGKSPCTWKDENEWFAESGLGRVAHGIPARSHRLRGLGNAIVPQVAQEILWEIRKTFDSKMILVQM